MTYIADIIDNFFYVRKSLMSKDMQIHHILHMSSVQNIYKKSVIFGMQEKINCQLKKMNYQREIERNIFVVFES